MSDDTLDLDSLQQQLTARLVLRHPVTGLPTKAGITIAGVEHPARKAAVFQRMRERRAELERTGKISMPDPADDDADEVALLVACTIGWDGLARGDQRLDFSPAAAAALYGDAKWRWVRNQVKNALDQSELFFGGSANA